jgi:hypothetical protein
MEVIHECEEAWHRLVTGKIPPKADAYDIKVWV